MSAPKKEGHSSYTNWRIYNDRAILKIVPSLLKKSNAQNIFTMIMILIASMGAVGFGIIVDGEGINHPQVFTGVCPPPAFINSKGCFVTVTTQVTVNGNVQSKEISQPAGQVLLPNGSATHR